ncbi:MAG: JAB domain-containing protein [Candidatus Humimicrobiaceae bacterium]
MKSYQQLGFTVNENDSKGNYIPRIQLSLVKEIYVSNPSFSCSQAIAEGEIAEKELRHSDREKFICIHLNIKNQIISYKVVSMRSLTSSIVRPGEVYKPAILANSASVLFIHNHPSGGTEPSLDDTQITDRLCKAGTILGINVLDHLIITNNDYFSFKQKGLI